MKNVSNTRIENVLQVSNYSLIYASVHKTNCHLVKLIILSGAVNTLSIWFIFKVCIEIITCDEKQKVLKLILDLVFEK